MISFRSLIASFLALALAGSMALAAPPSTLQPEALPAGKKMYVIERDMPGLGQLSRAELKAAAQKSCDVLKSLGPDITWLHSYITGDKMYCVYAATNEAIVREHAKTGGFPATAVNPVTTIIGPTTADE